MRLSYSLVPRARLDPLWLVARKQRIQYPGAVYHVMNRGDRREAIFADDADRERLLQQREKGQRVALASQALMGI